MATYTIVIYSLIIGWTLFSIYYIYRVWTQKRVVSYVYESIPTVFTTLGILGTFVGIYFGLQNFDVDKITESIPSLLDGMKTAFSTSIWGIVLSLIFGKVSQIILHGVDKKSPPKPTDELAALQEISLLLKEGNKQSNENFLQLNKSLIGETDDSISTQIFKLRNQFAELHNKQDIQNKTIEKVQLALGGDGETSLLTQIQKLRAEQNEYSKETKKNIDWIIESMNKNNELIRQKFDEFSELLAKNNTEALVEVMKSATEQFNTQMSALIERLVQENFQELNNSVQRMNKWQEENKEMISELTNQFKKVSGDFEISATSIKEITVNTTKLTNENSHLTKLIKELQKVMVDDTKFTEIVSNLTSTVEILKENTEAFDETTNKLNQWILDEHNFKESVEILIDRLKEIEEIKSIDGEFWKKTKTQLNEGLGIITKASSEIRNNLDEVNAEFQIQLKLTLTSLDELIQRLIKKNI
ncbi:MotA/TolQ/ExbB proton channel family protein [Breznakibacter xylanolyticus]|uniref:MotA/TolQ/ExbB proton channel family protein n=1 Tax=Breznakibacter xylanolyticus TaxID=990 RepID=A0A2W7N4D7_9BACT|nr:MotA/TolQ/ExbB proton channel family protein [Breznakibacter xylanolyticus]PZX14950.1 MotA/TolQ/ExbB proton channel family protein [Breznakibacter xylanolyticus]